MKDRLQELRKIFQNANMATDLSEFILFEQKSNCAMDTNGLCPLHVAISQNNIEKVKTMVENGANLEERTSWSQTLYLTPLLLAAKKGCIEITKVLIKEGADLGAKDKYGLTTLHLAVKYAPLRKVEGIVNSLIKSGAEINATCLEGWSPLHLAVEEHLTDIVELLLVNHANIDATYLDDISKTTVTPLMLAIEQDTHEMAKMLISKGAKLYPNMKDDESVLHFAIKEEDNKNQLDLIRFILNNGYDINIAEPCNGMSPLHVAISKKKIKIARLLLAENKSDVNAICHNHWSPLHLAIENGLQDIVLLLIENGANLESPSKAHCGMRRN